MQQSDFGTSGEYGEAPATETPPLLPHDAHDPHDLYGATDDADRAGAALDESTADVVDVPNDLSAAPLVGNRPPAGATLPGDAAERAPNMAATPAAASQRTSGAPPDTGALTAGGPHPSLHSVYAEALDGAIALAYADGGELAMLDGAGRRLVSRVRFHRSRAASASASQSGVGMMSGLGQIGAPSRPSQPWRPSSVPAMSRPPVGPSSGAHTSGVSYPSFPSFPGVASVGDEADDIEAQSTQAMPAAQSQQSQRPNERAWRIDEGLPGLAWRRAEPFVVRGDDYQTLARSGATPDPETLNAAWHLAIPIFRPGPLTNVRPLTDLIGVLTLYRNDPTRPFTGRELELLPLHADRAARAIRQIEVTHQYHSQVELLESFLDIGVNIRNLPEFYQRVGEVVRYAVEAPTFGVLLYVSNHEVTLDYGERDGKRIPQQLLAVDRLPAWWWSIRQGQTVVIPSFASPGELQGNPTASPYRGPQPAATQPGRRAEEVALVGWGGDQPVRSLLAAPLLIGSKPIGALVVASPRAGVYPRERVHVVETLARGVAVIIENSRLSGDMQRAISLSRQRARQLAALSNAVLTINSSLEVDSALKLLADQASLLTHAQVCAVFLMDEAQQVMVGRATNTLSGEMGALALDARIPLSWHGLSGVLKGESFTLLDNLDAEWQDGSETGRLLGALGMVSCLALPITSQGAVTGAIFVYTPRSRDHFPADEVGLLQGLASQGASAISNARLYQELQQAYEEQKALDRLKDEFILTVSHEFRTPLTAIEGYVTLISRHGHRLEQAKLTQFAAEIHQATTQLAGMISMLADANRMSNQPLQVTLRPTNLRAVAASAIATQSPEAKERIALNIPDDLWALADDERLTLVFSNLVSNAIKYSPEQAPCSVYAAIASRSELARQGRAHAQAEGAPERWVVITVRDQGPGISPEDQAKLFQKFVRLSQSLTTAVRGTGLGLWICRQYVTAMGGDIWVESALQQGSRFEFCLPLVAAPTSGV